MRERNAERSAACATCGKTFARSDTLLRHEKSHLSTEDRGPVHRVTNGTFRACCACAQARSRCSGGDPCGRCKIRSLDCVYPAKRRKTSTTVPDRIGDIEEKPSHQHKRSTAPARETSQQPLQFQELVFSSVPDIPRVGDQPSSPAAPQQAHTPIDSTGIHRPTQNEPTQQSIEYSSNLNQPMVQTQHGAVNMDMHGMPPYANDMIQRDQYGNPMQQQDYQLGPNAQVPNFGYDSTYDESMNLNWIPLSVFHSPYGDLDQDLAFLIPSLPESGNIATPFDAAQYDLAPRAPTSMNPDLQFAKATSEGNGSNAMLGFAQSPASSTSEGIGTIRSSYSDNYMNEPRKRPKKSLHAQEHFAKSRRISDDFAFPNTTELSARRSNHSWCYEPQYASIKHAFRQLCLHSTHFLPFGSQTFPDFQALNACLDLYFENFHSSFPLLHVPTFGPETPWSVVLAVATIGSNFAPLSACVELKEAFQEFLRRAIVLTTDDESETFDKPHLIQAQILNLVSLAQSDRARLRALTPHYHAGLSRWCLESGLLQVAAPEEPVRIDFGSDQALDAWRRWVYQESNRRIGYFIWFLDCAYGYLCNTRPLCNMDDARAPLPCPEALWNASTPEQWLALKVRTPTMPSLCAAMEEMYGQKKVMTGLSEISYTLLIHALYSRTWEVGTHIKQPLSEWRSTGNARGFLNTPSKDNFWLPLYPLYANWRNSACDCLDVLHWQASSVVAQASGNEHHGVLQLHLARIILLTPFQELQDLIFFKIDYDVGDNSKATYYVHDGSYQRRNRGKADQIRKITRRWLCEDQHKARLAMIHAGSVFWHIKRFSSGSFFEPLAVYLASIVLWTYGSYKSAALGREANGSTQAYQNPYAHDINVQPSRVEMAASTFASSRKSSHSHFSSPPQAHGGAANLDVNQATSTKTNRNLTPMATDSPAAPRSNYSGHSNTITSNNVVAAAARTNDRIEDGRLGSHQPSSTGDDNDNDNDNGDDEDDQDDDEQDLPTFIHLDRPCDDEIVQHFVRNGHNMSGHMSNVGDICKTPNKVLTEGAKLLKGKLACWGVSRRYYDILTKVAETNT